MPWLRKKGVSHVLWFIAAFVIVLILIVIGIIILGQGEEYGLAAIDDMFTRMEEALG
ncbi:MAG: hypothetical protein JSV92_01095 [archaeon]|nr:MAG: hypothetical protein JSV92_01095 [archaeon]